MRPMEKIIAKLLGAFERWLIETSNVIVNASTVEQIMAASLPVIACILGSWLNHRIDRMSQRSWKTKFVDFIGPLLAPLFSLLFVSLAASYLKATGHSHALLSFAAKVSIAWLIVRVVLLMSSRRTAGWVIALVVMPAMLLDFFGLWDPVSEALKAIKFSIGDVKLSAFIIVKTISAIIILFWIAGFLIDRVDYRLKRMHGVHVSNKALMSKLFQILIYFAVFIIILQVIGISMTALSVFGGALGVGIGFGLQKIASNFISGIILLFEKSSQIGDLVELADGTTGIIQQTSARYTHISAFDGREILIPNEDFITQRTVNWTYTNKRARVDIPIGVAYDTDLEKAKELVVAAARAHPKCLADPAPACFYTAFADSSINMVLYFWVEDVTDGRLGPKSDVIIAIQKSFDENGIVIPFPHQVHVEPKEKE